jgi:hypothetical protein
MCVVEPLQDENTRVYGRLRLVSYAHFLPENYFPVHDELCNVCRCIIFCCKVVLKYIK